MVAWMNAAALEATFATGYATFFSRSRQALWQKGETSGNRLRVDSVRLDCDGDTVLLLVDPDGPSCHTGRPSCFFESLIEAEQTNPPVGDSAASSEARAPELVELERVIELRSRDSAAASYTRSLIDGGAERIGDKLREEADELARALTRESVDRVASEAADLVYHLLVGLRLREVPLRAVLAELDRRAGKSGHAEKAE